MTKQEFLTQLLNELKKKDIADAEDIAAEYEQHFAFKLADGFSEEKIAAKLGDPAALAAQFENDGKTAKSGGGKAVALVGLVFADIFAGVFFVLLFAFLVILGALSLTCTAAAVCLFVGGNIASLLPPMPYGCGVIFGVSLAALAVLTGVGCVYFTAFIRQLIRSYGRFHHNNLAASGGKVLPPLAMHPQLTPRTNRRLRAVALISLAVFAACFVLGMIVSMIVSGALGFWHAWGWFGYTGPLYKGGVR